MNQEPLVDSSRCISSDKTIFRLKYSTTSVLISIAVFTIPNSCSINVTVTNRLFPLPCGSKIIMYPWSLMLILWAISHFAGNYRKYQARNIISSQLSISIPHYLQIQRAEISFSARHQSVNDIFALKSITVSSFSDCQNMKTVQWRHYSEMKRWRHYNVFISSLLHMA